MSEVVMAVYEKGVLRPLHPLKLRERQRVYIQVLTEEASTEAEQVSQLLVAAGLMRPSPAKASPPPNPVSPEERRELAEILGQAPGKPLSEIVIEERGVL